MVSAEDALFIYRRLSDNDLQVWLTGGWGIDALLGEQTRPHKDLDAILLLDDMVRMCEILSRDGYSLKEFWPENSWVIDGHGIKTATAFVLRDAEEREFDAHAIRLDDHGNGVPAWEVADGFIFKRQDLAGEGVIADFPVKCITPKMQVVCHTGYELPEKQLHDLELLYEKFGFHRMAHLAGTPKPAKISP